ncbi:lactonase family protein [Abyssalbus ytuae]|uniref:Lactonase family protein n=1 Tax=Abyssalbus ytuae TaxID=2926907 RepID=A0A9E7CV35_9FLAO|nr:lactonase family protein [Abyssalbus ytuae]UOB19332.1 lactonase family protein [Abyssalbus ytuae]
MKIRIKLLAIVFLFFSLLSCKQQKKDTKQPETMVEKPQKTENIELLAGTYTDSMSKGIYKLFFNPVNGTLENKGLVAETVSPSYLDISKNQEYVYAVNESNPGQVSSFKWNNDHTLLEPVSQQPADGAHPCFVELNKEENMLAVANYTSGNVVIYKIDQNGQILPSPQNKKHEGNGPVLPNQESAHAHCSKFSEDGKFIYIADLGIDKIISYPIDENGNPGGMQTALDLDKGDGPRHFVFHPSKEIVFIINELSGSVVSARVNNQTGIFERIDKKSTLPDDYTGNNACADIHITSNGKFLYASNRGHNSIAVFKVNDNGMLERIGNEPVQGDWPRNFTLSPDEKFLLVANQNTNNITVFTINPDTGLLTYTGNQAEVSKPVCLKF